MTTLLTQSSLPGFAIWQPKTDIHLIRNRRQIGFTASSAAGIKAAKSHDVALFSANIQMPSGWLRRLAAHAYANPNTATVSPLSNINGGAVLAELGDPAGHLDEICRTMNVGRSVAISNPIHDCIYIRRAALDANPFVGRHAKSNDFFLRAAATGWQHRLACDMFVYRNTRPALPHASVPMLRDIRQSLPQLPDLGFAIPFMFAVTAAFFRRSKLPVILMITHNFGGGVRRHIDNLVARYHHTAHVLLLEGTDRGTVLSVPILQNHPTLTLPASRIDDLIAVLQSMSVCRIHIHHLLQMDIDIQILIQRLGLPFDVTVHDYFAICPQINLLRWSEGIYCSEPAPFACNACIADQSSHGARDITSWRRGSVWQFMNADRVICPSSDVRARLHRYGLGKRAIVVPHEPQTQSQWFSRIPKPPFEPIRIVLLGVLANHKGARTVAEVAETADRGTIQIHLAGCLESSFPKPAARLIKSTGKYQDKDLAKMLRRIDPHVFWFPSSTPETYSYTLSTAIATGLPIVATDLGSFTERLSGRPLTWLVDHRASAQEWLSVFKAVLATLRDRPDLLPAPRRTATADFYANDYLPSELTKQIETAKTPAGRNAEPDVRLRHRPASTQVSRRTVRDAPRIAIVPERYATGGLTPCAYIRLLQPLDHPSVSGVFDIILANTETVFNCDADIIVTQRFAISDLSTANRLANHAQRTGAKLLFDLDDDLLNVPRVHPDVLEIRLFAKVVRRMLTVADAVWVSTPGLASRVGRIRPDAAVIENRLDERIWTYIPAQAALHENPVRILCMGTRTHKHDFSMIEPVLLRLKAEFGDRIVIDILGMTDQSELPVGLNRISPPTHAARSYPGFVNWLTSTQPRWHIGLAPLLDTTFNGSKSPIKAMDYAALGLAVLASDTPVYRGSIADGPAGQLVANEHAAWHAALDWLIRNQDLRQCTAKGAREAFLTHATLASHADTRRKALADLLQTATPRACDGARSR